MSKSFHALVLGIVLLVGGPSLATLHAQDGEREAGRTYPRQLEITFEWLYSCPSTGKACSFNCRGSGASNVTKLAIRLGTIPLGGNEKTFGIFYEFSSKEIPNGNGFNLTTGISTLSCQVQGMNLDYSGPRETPTESVPQARR
jgi:hypothetical protein